MIGPVVICITSVSIGGAMRERGFTFTEILIVVAILSILTMIAVPNLLAALNKARQGRTMGDLRSIAQAVEAYSVDNGYFPRVATGSVEALAPILEPAFIQTMPIRDGWGNPMQWVSDAAGRSYTVWSKGRDFVGMLEAGGITHKFTKAIVYTEGRFAQWPEGEQR